MCEEKFNSDCKQENKNIKSEDNKKTNIFNLEILTRIAFYGLLIGFIYNYIYFDLLLEFNILDVIEPQELLFSWLGTAPLLAAVIVLFFSYVFIAFAKDFKEKDFCFYSFVSFIVLILLFAFCFLLKPKFVLNDFYLTFFMLIAMVFVISFIGSKNPSEIHNANLVRIELIIVISIIIFTAFYAYFEYKKLLKEKRQVQISLKSDYSNKAYNNDKSLFFIGRTSSVVIVTKDIPREGKISNFITFYTSDISSIDFLPLKDEN